MTIAAKAALLRQEARLQILFATDQVISARVRGDSGIYDVRWDRLEGWHCTCAAWGRCSHVEAVASVTMRPVGVR